MNILNSIFTLILVYGYPVIAIAVFLTSAGVPLPGIAIVLVAGSLAASDNHNIGILFFLVTICSVLGDIVDYFLGRGIGNVVIEKICKHSKLVNRSLTKIQKYFSKWSGISIFLSRWLVPPLAPTVSVLAGITKYPLKRFLIFDILGEIVSSIIFLGLGYEFSVNWPSIWSNINSVFGIGVGVVIGCALVFIGLRKFLRKKK